MHHDIDLLTYLTNSTPKTCWTHLKICEHEHTIKFHRSSRILLYSVFYSFPSQLWKLSAVFMGNPTSKSTSNLWRSFELRGVQVTRMWLQQLLNLQRIGRDNELGGKREINWKSHVSSRGFMFCFCIIYIYILYITHTSSPSNSGFVAAYWMYFLTGSGCKIVARMETVGNIFRINNQQHLHKFIVYI